ncbi:MAG: hypothetical protein LAP85_25215 [Acidobacteriia bacterium]|nr:hypothetical protein [Terriglobia bacterium]
MATRAQLSWPANAAEEQVTGYNVYMDGAQVANTQEPKFEVDITPEAHTFAVSAVNVWGEGPQSDPVKTPAPCSKVGGLSISIVVNVSVTQ